MALIKTLPDPFQAGLDRVDCYIRWADLTVSPRTKTVRLAFEVYASRADLDAGRPPLPIPFEYAIGPLGRPAVLGPEPVDAAGNPTGEPAPLVAPAVPSYDEWRAAANEASAGAEGVADLIGAMVYAYARSQPELADARDA